MDTDPQNPGGAGNCTKVRENRARGPLSLRLCWPKSEPTPTSIAKPTILRS